MAYALESVAGLRDPFAGKALSLLHARPDDAMPIEGLGPVALGAGGALSPNLVGIPLMHYLARIADADRNGGHHRRGRGRNRLGHAFNKIVRMPRRIAHAATAAQQPVARGRVRLR